METLSALVALCEENPAVNSENPSQKDPQLMRSFDFRFVVNPAVRQTIKLPVISDTMTQYNVHLISIQGRAGGHQGREH